MAWIILLRAKQCLLLEGKETKEEEKKEEEEEEEEEEEKKKKKLSAKGMENYTIRLYQA